MVELRRHDYYELPKQLMQSFTFNKNVLTNSSKKNDLITIILIFSNTTMLFFILFRNLIERCCHSLYSLMLSGFHLFCLLSNVLRGVLLMELKTWLEEFFETR